MNILQPIKKIKRLPNFIVALVMTALLSVFITSVAIGSTPVTMEGHTKSLNVTKGQTTYTDSTDLKIDEVAQVQLWHHNREAPSGAKAKNTVVKFNVPSASGKKQVITGITTSDNGNTISDTTQINLSQDKAKLQYIPGSAKFRYNKGAADGRQECMTGYEFPADSCYATVPISDEAIRDGVNLDTLRGGPLNGCNAYHETVTIQVRSIIDAISVDKFVRHLGQGASDWSRTADAKPGDKIEYLIRFKNEGNTMLNDVMVGDNLPKYNKYVNGSTKLSNIKYPDGLAITNDNITKGGINVGSYGPGIAGYVWFTVQLDEKGAYEKCGMYQVANVGVVRPAGMNEFYNTATVNINNECREEPNKIVVCDDLVANKYIIMPGEEVTFTATGSATNTAIDEYEFVLNGVKGGQSASNTYVYTATETGTYTVRVYIHSTDGQRVTGSECVKTIEVQEEEEKIVTCDSLEAPTLTLNIGESTTFTAKATASGGAEIFGYVFTINDVVAQVAETNQFTATALEAGVYEVAVIVVSDIGEHTSENCVKTVTVVEEEEPVYACEYFKLSRNKIQKDQTIEFTVKVTALNGADFKHATFTFGDEAEDSDKFVTNSIENGIVKTNHTYKTKGDYAPRVAITFNVNGQMVTVNDPECAGQVAVSETPRCPIEGKEHLPKGHKDCNEVKGVSKLPDTGAGGIAGLLASITAIGTVAHRKASLRKQ